MGTLLDHCKGALSNLSIDGEILHKIKDRVFAFGLKVLNNFKELELGTYLMVLLFDVVLLDLVEVLLWWTVHINLLFLLFFHFLNFLLFLQLS